MTGPVERWWLGPLGALQEIRGPLPGQAVRDDTATAVTRLLGGGMHVQRRRPVRAWPLSYDLLTDAELSVLDALNVGAFGSGPLRLIDPRRRNRLPAGLSAVSTVDGFTATAGTIAAGGPRYAAQSVGWTVPSGTAAGARAGTGPVVPLVAGQQVTGSLYVRCTLAVAAALVWYDAAGALISTVTGVGGAAADWQRRTVTAVPPAGAALAGVAAATTAAAGADTLVEGDQWQLEEGSAAAEWVVGSAVPKVAFVSAAASYPMQGLLAADVELVEVA